MSKWYGAVVFLVLLLALPNAAVAQAEKFEAISINPSMSTDPRNMRVQIMPNGDFSATSLHVFFAVRYVVQHLENWTDLPVVNETALNGLYAIEAGGWRPMKLPPPPPGAPQGGTFDDLPTIFTVLKKLGLELKQKEAAVTVYTIDRIDRAVPLPGDGAD